MTICLYMYIWLLRILVFSIQIFTQFNERIFRYLLAICCRNSFLLKYQMLAHHFAITHTLCIQLSFNLLDIHQIYWVMSCMTGCFHTTYCTCICIHYFTHPFIHFPIHDAINPLTLLYVQKLKMYLKCYFVLLHIYHLLAQSNLDVSCEWKVPFIPGNIHCLHEIYVHVHVDVYYTHVQYMYML